MTAVAHRSAEQIGRTDTGPRPLPALGPTREVPLPDAVEHTLPNGLRVLAARRAAVPMVELRLRVPFAGDEPDHPAVAELLTSTLLTGTATRDRVEIDDELAAVGADLGVSVDPEKLWISGSGLATGFGQMLEVLVDVLTAATHPDHEVTRERERLVERITLARAQPRTIAREALQRKRFGDHPITREMPGEAEAAAVTAEQLRALQAAALVPRGSILTVVGDLDPAAAIDQVGELLAGWTSEHAARELSAPPPITPGDLELVHRPGSVQTQLRLTAAAVPRRDPAYPALQLTNLVFGGYFSSRWMENIREDKGYTYGAHSGLETIPGGAVLGVETDVASDVTAPALLETRYELGRMAAVPPTAGGDRRGPRVRGRFAADLAGQPGRAGLDDHRAGRRRARPGLAAGLPRRAGSRDAGRGGGRGAALLRPGRVHRRAGRGRVGDRPRGAGAGRDRRMSAPPRDFGLLDPPVLSRNTVRRDEMLRTDLDAQLRGWPTARLVIVDAEGRTPVEWDGDGPAGRRLGPDGRQRRPPAHQPDQRGHPDRGGGAARRDRRRRVLGDPRRAGRGTRTAPPARPSATPRPRTGATWWTCAPPAPRWTRWVPACSSRPRPC